MDEESEYGDFEEIADEGEEKEEENALVPTRARAPHGKEKIGMVLQRLGGKRMHVKATDGKIRNCRVPGRYQRKLWLRPKDVVIIVPWEDDDEKADIIYKYPPAAINQLRKQGIIQTLEKEF